MTSVARLMLSTSDSRQPYRLSNLTWWRLSRYVDGRERQLAGFLHLIRRFTPVVVSSVTPRMLAWILEYQFGAFSNARGSSNSATSSSARRGCQERTSPLGFARSPAASRHRPSSRIMLACRRRSTQRCGGYRPNTFGGFRLVGKHRGAARRDSCRMVLR